MQQTEFDSNTATALDVSAYLKEYKRKQEEAALLQRPPRQTAAERRAHRLSRNRQIFFLLGLAVGIAGVLLFQAWWEGVEYRYSLWQATTPDNHVDRYRNMAGFIDVPPGHEIEGDLIVPRRDAISIYDWGSE